MSVSGRPDNAHLYIALKRGYFAEAGLDVEAVELGNPADRIPALSSNQIQISTGTATASLFNALSRGVSIRVVADLQHVGGPTDTSVSIIARKQLYDSGEVRSMADLRGRTFGGAAAPGTTGDLLYQRALARENVSGAEINVEYVQLADMLSALANGSVDAGILLEPLVSAGVAQGIASVLIPGGAVIPGASMAVVLYQPHFASDQPEAARRWMVGYLKGVRDYYDAFHLKQNREAAIDLLTQETTLKDPRAWENFPPASIDLNGKVAPDAIRELATLYAQLGALTGPPPDVEQFVDSQFADAAVQQLGRR